MSDPHVAAARRRWEQRTAPQPAEPGRRRSRPAPPRADLPEPVDAVRPDGRRIVAAVLPWSRPPLTLNTRLGWAARNRTVQAVAEAVAWVLRDVEPIEGPVEVEVIRYVGSGQVADADNLAAFGKPCLDGATSARVLPADDHSVVVRTSQRVVSAEGDPLGPGHPRIVLVIAQADRGAHEQYDEAGEVITT